MTIFDLVFLLLVLGTVAWVIVVLTLLVRKGAGAAGRWLGAGVCVWLIYLAAGTAVAAGSSQRVIEPGGERCFDEMCFGVAGVKRQGSRLEVVVRVANRGRGRAQSEGGAEAWLLDAGGERYRPSSIEGWKLDARLGAGETELVRLVFEVPAGAHGLGLVVGHSYAINPARIILGDEDHVLHKPTVLDLGE